MSESIIRLGTRDSQLAMWQANSVHHNLLEHNIHSEIIPTKSAGDIVLDKPLHQMGITGVFTKALDDALLNEEIDIAVHSHKDLPTRIHKDLEIIALLEREDQRDILVRSNLQNNQLPNDYKNIVATGSLRRKSQWLAKYPNDDIVGLRGNVNTRLKKLDGSNWLGAIFAFAGLKRLNLHNRDIVYLDWMIPAPAQGSVAIIARKDDIKSSKVKAIHNIETEITTRVERDFLQYMEGGCISPIGANAKIIDEVIHFNAIVLSLDGKISFSHSGQHSLEGYKSHGKKVAIKLGNQGATKLIKQIEKEINSQS